MTTTVYEVGLAPGAADKAEGQSCRARIASWMRRLAEAERARRELTAMSDVELKDVGLTRGEIGAVVNGTFSR